MKTIPTLPLILAIFGLSSSVYAANLWRNDDEPVAKYDYLGAWIHQDTKTITEPQAGDTLKLGSNDAFQTTFNGDVTAYQIEVYGGTNYFTDDEDGVYSKSSFNATYRAYFFGGVSNIYSVADTANGEERYTFTTKDAFIVGDNDSSYTHSDTILNIYGATDVVDNGWGFCFGESAKKYSTTVNVYDTADLKGELKIGSKTYAEAAKTTVNFYGNSTGTISKLSMHENATLNIYGDAKVHVSNGDINIFNGQDDTRKVFVNLSDNGKLSGIYKVYQYNADVKLADNSNITVVDYYLGVKTASGDTFASDTLTIDGKASVVATSGFRAFEESNVNITGTTANLTAKNLYLLGGAINNSATGNKDNINVNVSDNIYISNYGSLNLSAGYAKTNATHVGYNGSAATRGSLIITGGEYVSKYLTAYGESKILVDGGKFEVTNQGKGNGIAFNGASTMTIQNGATADIDRFAMYDKDAKIELKGSGLNVTAWCIGGDKVEDPNYSTQKGTVAFVADANGISTLVSTYLDFNFNVLLDFTDYVFEGEKTFDIITITSGYYSMVKNWTDNWNDASISPDEKLIKVITANDQDTYAINLVNNRTLSITYNHVAVVPEPSTYAAIFGALALAFVAYKRRKK